MPEATSRERKPKNNSRQTAVLGGQTRAGQKKKKLARVPALFYILYLVHQKKEKKGEELLDAKGREMPFLKLAMSKM